MIASLPMYARAENADAHGRFWALLGDELRALGVDAPEALDQREDPWAVWRHPDLLLSQTCSLPFRARLHGQVRVIAAPDYGLPDAAPGAYFSAIVVRKDDPRERFADFTGARVAINDGLSQSGWAALAEHGRKEGIPPFTDTVLTGSHRASARAVARGEAALAAIDAISWRLMERWDDFTRDLKVLARTDPTPGLPFVTARGRDPAPIFTALQRAIDRFPIVDRDALGGLRGVVETAESAYLGLSLPPECPENRH